MQTLCQQIIGAAHRHHATMPPGVGGGRRPTVGTTGQAHSIDLWSNLNIIRMGYILPLWISSWYGVDKIEMKKSRDDSVELYQARWESAAIYCMVYFYKHSGILQLVVYRVFSKGRNEVGPSKSLIFWTFSDVLDFFWPFNMGDFSFWYFWVIWLKKKLKNLILQKG